jgi:hypothetical protein
MTLSIRRFFFPRRLMVSRNRRRPRVLEPNQELTQMKWIQLWDEADSVLNKRNRWWTTLKTAVPKEGNGNFFKTDRFERYNRIRGLRVWINGGRVLRTWKAFFYSLPSSSFDRISKKDGTFLSTVVWYPFVACPNQIRTGELSLLQVLLKRGALFFMVEVLKRVRSSRWRVKKRPFSWITNIPPELLRQMIITAPPAAPS